MLGKAGDMRREHSKAADADRRGNRRAACARKRRRHSLRGKSSSRATCGWCSASCSALQRGENADDLFQVGCVGLIKAIDNFDISQKVRFSTYGVPMIIGEIQRFCATTTPLRVSRSMRDTAYRALQAREAPAKSSQREPTIEEIAHEPGSRAEEVVFAMDA